MPRVGSESRHPKLWDSRGSSTNKHTSPNNHYSSSTHQRQCQPNKHQPTPAERPLAKSSTSSTRSQLCWYAKTAPHQLALISDTAQNTHLDRQQLSYCVSLIENGANPEALAVRTSLFSFEAQQRLTSRAVQLFGAICARDLYLMLNILTLHRRSYCSCAKSIQLLLSMAMQRRVQPRADVNQNPRQCLCSLARAFACIDVSCNIKPIN
jgi:hypothetical protein